ncbi:TPA: transposase, partial [Escherichia coli]
MGTHLFNKWTPVIEQKTLSAEPRRSFSNEFKLQMVKLALQPRDSVACIAREHDIN